MKAVTRALRAESFLVSPLKMKRQSALLLIFDSSKCNINLSVHGVKMNNSYFYPKSEEFNLLGVELYD